MSKLSYIFTIIIGLFIFNSCSNDIEQNKNVNNNATSKSTSQIKKSYGSYLAGRVAHLRKDFNKAADYYIVALDEDPKNKELVSRVYVILASKGRIAEASKYAKLALENNDQNNFTYIIIASDEIKNNRFAEANMAMNKMQGDVYKEFIVPMMSSWAYVGLNQPDKALKTIKAIEKEPSFKALYHFHAGMINDYFDRTDEAKKHYEIIVNEESLEMSFRSLQIISNFYIRNGQKDKAIKLVKKYNDDKTFVDMINNLNQNVINANPQKTEKIIKSPQDGVAEALFSIAATLRQGTGGIDLAHVFISLSIFENPNYDLAKLLLADILENREMYSEANEVYDQISQTSESYNTVQIKRARNMVLAQDYASAELLLKSLTIENPNNYQLLLDLGDVLRIRNKHGEAIKYYKMALESLPKVEDQHWVLYYAMGISYEQDGDWKRAEKSFKKALKLSQNHYLVLNYLGYSWLKDGKNIEEAFGMVVEAYNQTPQDGNITDSLGLAFYKLGYYDQSITYLEKAAELEPANAVISDHLGDAYWFGRRENEAVFQWKHSLTMKDDSGELNTKKIRAKIKDGLTENNTPSFNQELINEKIETINKD